MSFTFTNNPASSNRDAVRIMLHDTSSGSAKLSDETIDWLLSAEPNLYLAAAAGAETIASEAAREPSSKSVGDLSISYAETAVRYSTLAKSLRMRGIRRVSPVAGGISQSAKDTQYGDSDMTSPAFKVGQFDNPGSTST
jgi:hypothetical protein